MDLTDGSYAINISGGTVIAYSSTGDGFDSNGSLTISGGTVAVWTANGADNEPLDADGTVTISGGTVLAAGGSSGMGMNLNAQQSCLIFGGNTSAQMGGQPQEMPTGTAPEKPEFPDSSAPLEAPDRPDNQQAPNGTTSSGTLEAPTPPDQNGQMPTGEKPQGMGGSGNAGTLLTENSTFSILDAQGNTLYAGTAPCNTVYLLFSAPGFSDGTTATLSSGDTETTATAQSGTLSTGRGGMGNHGGNRQFPKNGGDKATGQKAEGQTAQTSK